MKNIFKLKGLLLLCFLFYSNVGQAHDYNDYAIADECCAPAYDCGDPLVCGSANFLIHAGVAPTQWKGREPFTLVSCNALAIPSFGQTLINLFDPMPRFRDFFKTPWIVGGQFGYALTNNFEVYLEVNYRHAARRSFISENVAAPNTPVNINFQFSKHYRAIDAYVGARYYWGRYWCNNMAVFLGAKFGVVHHKPICFNFSIAQTDCTLAGTTASSASTLPFFFRSTHPAAGLNLGFDWCLGCGWSVVLMAEAVATCGPKPNQGITLGGPCPVGGSSVALPLLGAPTNLLIGHVGTELFFPVTLGVKYSF